MKQKSVLLLAILVAGISRAMAQQTIINFPQISQSRTDLYFNLNKFGTLKKRFDFLLPGANRMVLEFTTDEQVGSLPDIDSLVTTVWKDLTALGDSLASPLNSKRIDVVFSVAERRIRVQDFAQQGTVYRIKNADITQLKIEQDTLRLSMFATKANAVFSQGRPYYITFLINHLTDLPALLQTANIAQTVMILKNDFAARRFKNSSMPFTQYNAIYDVATQRRVIPKQGALIGYGRKFEFIPYAQMGIQYLRGAWAPSAGAGMELTIKHSLSFENKFQLFWEPYFVFDKDSLKQVTTLRNDFITFRYSSLSSYTGVSRHIEFRQTYSFSYLIRRRGELFEATTFKFSLPGLQTKNIMLEPEAVFNRFFKNFSPSLKLTLFLE